MTRLRLLMSAVFLCVLLPVCLSADIIYVRSGASGVQDGSTWFDAYHTIGAALADPDLASGDEVRVAQGTYSERIILVPGVALLGGYNGFDPNPDDRNPSNYITTINGGYMGTVVTVPDSAPNTTVIDGFTITQGYAANGGGIYVGADAAPEIRNNSITSNQASDLGGGIYCAAGSAPHISMNRIAYNTATNGGGIYCDDDCTALIQGNPEIILNQALSGNGGGIYCDHCSPEIRGNGISQNYAFSGGGIFCLTASPSIIGNEIGSAGANIVSVDGGGICCTADSEPGIDGNRITTNQASGYGGGISCDHSSPTVSQNNEISLNYAANGGGIACRNLSEPAIYSNIITNNTANTNGGGIYSHNSTITVTGNEITANKCSLNASKGCGIYCESTTGSVLYNKIMTNQGTAGGMQGGGIYSRLCTSALDIANNLIQGNTGVSMGGGVMCDLSSPDIINNTIMANAAHGIMCFNCAPKIANNIVTSNLVGIGKVGTQSPVLNNNDVWSNTTNYSGLSAGTGDISSDPKLDGNYRLQSDSPCIDAGSNAAVVSGWTDIDGQPRIMTPWGGVVDIGADEYPKGKVPTPTFNPPGGTYSDAVCVAIESETGATVRYTLDGTEPDTDDPILASGSCVTIKADAALKAKAWLSPFQPSDTASASYAFTKVATPEFTPDGGRFDEDTEVTITCATPGATIRYTIDCTIPTESSPVVPTNGKITLKRAGILKAKAWKTGLTPSDVKSTAFLVQVIFVDRDSPGGDGMSWETAFKTIQEGVNKARQMWDDYFLRTGELDIWDLWVADGTYYEHVRLEPVAIYGAFQGGEGAIQQRTGEYPTIVDGGNGNYPTDWPVFYDEAGHPVPAGSRLDSLVIQNGAQSGICLTIGGEMMDIIIENCKISNNGFDVAEGVPGQPNVGGIYCGPLIGGPGYLEVRNCEIDGNYGSGIEVYSRALIENCIIHGNKSGTGAGIRGDLALAVSYDGRWGENLPRPLLIRNNHIYLNTARMVTDTGSALGEGGGLYGMAHAAVYNNLIEANMASHCGGGIALTQANGAIVAGNVIRNNWIYDTTGLEYGGGIYVRHQGCYPATLDSYIVNNHILDNVLGKYPQEGGAGIAIVGYGCDEDGKAGTHIWNNLIRGNECLTAPGGGLYITGHTHRLYLHNNTVVKNISPFGNGYFFDFTPVEGNLTGRLWMWNDIVFKQSQTVHFENQAAQMVIDHNDVEIWSGITDPTGTNGNISIDPMFRPNDPLYHLAKGSPCIDAGRTRQEAEGMTVTFPGMLPYVPYREDIDLDIRYDNMIDMGADEFMKPNGVSDAKMYGWIGDMMAFGDVSITAVDTERKCIYAESFDRVSGIRIDVDDPSDYGVGQVVQVVGTKKLDSTNGELYIDAWTGYPKKTGEPYYIAPLGMINSSVGGSGYGYQPGIDGAFGLNNIGLLVKVWGTITYSTTGMFYLDDGSGMDDGSGYDGIRVVGPAGADAVNGRMVCVTGISTCYKMGESIKRMLIIRSPDDVFAP